MPSLPTNSSSFSFSSFLPPSPSLPPPAPPYKTFSSFLLPSVVPPHLFLPPLSPYKPLPSSLPTSSSSSSLQTPFFFFLALLFPPPNSQKSYTHPVLFLAFLPQGPHACWRMGGQEERIRSPARMSSADVPWGNQWRLPVFQCLHAPGKWVPLWLNVSAKLQDPYVDSFVGCFYKVFHKVNYNISLWLLW